MMLFRRLASAVLAAALAAGCSQSLFDANPGNGGDGDGGQVRADANLGLPDAGSMGGLDGAPPADAGLQESCPAPCVGDAVDDFRLDQDGAWRYAETALDADGVPLFRDMTYATWSSLAAWSGATSPPAIVSCRDNTGAAECQGVADKLMLVPTGNAPGSSQPALIWKAPRTGSFRVTADWRSPDNSTPGLTRSLIVARNSLFDAVYTTSFPTSTEQRVLDFEVDALADDTVAFSMTPDDNANVPLGVSMYVTELGRNEDCQMTARFESATQPFDNRCGDLGAFVDGGAALTQLDEAPPGIPGAARLFSDQSSLQYQGAPIDYSGDWTVQFWAAIDGSGEILSDHTCTMIGDQFVSGGIAIRYDIETMFIRVGDELSNVDCLSGSGAGTISLSDGPEIQNPAAWHLYRVVRDKSAGTVTACVDGKYRSNQVRAVPSEATMATTRPLDLGHQRSGTAGSFAGKITDLRVYDRVLPCPLPNP